MTSRELGVVVALLLSPHGRGRLRDALRGRSEPIFVERCTEVVAALARRASPVGALVVEPRCRDGLVVGDLIPMLRRRDPALPVVAYCPAGAAQSPDLRALALAGVNEFLFEEVGDSALVIRAVLVAARRGALCDCASSALTAILPPSLHALVRCVTASPTMRDVASVASSLGLHRRTLAHRSAQSHTPSPQELIGWCRLAVASQLLTVTGTTVESIAHELDYPSSTSLRNAFKRYLGYSATDVRRLGGLPVVVERLRQQLTRSAEPERSRHLA